MTSEESKFEILKRVQAGILSPEEGAALLGILDGGEPELELPSTQAVESSTLQGKAEGQKVSWLWKAFWSVFLWLGVGLTVLSAYWMYRGYEAAGLGVGFFLSWIPFAFGIGLTYAGTRLLQAYWVYVKINTTEHGKLQKIELSLPLPLSFAAWIFKNFGQFMPEEIRAKHMDEMLAEIENAIRKDEPFQVNVDDDKSGDKVEVTIA